MPICLFGFIPDDPNMHPSNYKMGFYDMNLGIDFRYSQYNSSSNSTVKNNIAGGISERLQSSFLGHLKKDKKFVIGDLLSAELAQGMISSNYSNAHSSLWLSYRFQFGVGMIYRFNTMNDLGLNIMLLEFARDDVSPNISGSNILLRYRHSKCIFETGLAARRGRVFGWITAIPENNPMQLMTNFRYLINEKKNIGIRAEWFPYKLTEGTEYFNNITSIRFFYGIYF
jgi:hypothetical protein